MSRSPGTRPWAMWMEWHQLLFAHWPVDAALLADRLPRGLELETWQGQAWLGIVPFRMVNTRPRGIPPLPGISHFPELNVRTYVRAAGVPGVWFFSLDAGNPLAVLGARVGFHLPYFAATMRCEQAGAEVYYTSRRWHPLASPAVFAASYAPDGPVQRTQPGTLEHWLTERSCLYSADRRGRLWRGWIQHKPWPLQPARASIAVNTMAAPLGLRLSGPPLLHYAERLDVVGWLLEPV